MHWRTGLDIWGGGKPKSASRGETGGMLHREIKKNTCRMFLMPFPAFLSRFSCKEQVINEKKIVIRNINETKPKQENCPTLK